MDLPDQLDPLDRLDLLGALEGREQQDHPVPRALMDQEDPLVKLVKGENKVQLEAKVLLDHQEALDDLDQVVILAQQDQLALKALQVRTDY